MKSNLKLVHFNPNHNKTENKDETFLVGLASNHLKTAQTNINMLLKELGKIGALDNDAILAHINAIKQNLYVAQDCVKEVANG